jgi:S1-C subfamily serine protease
VAVSADQPVKAETPPGASAAPSIAPLSAGARTEDERNSIDVFRLAAPSTVFVTQNKLVVDYFAGTRAEVPSGSGSGFIWDAQGHIVTNFHVISGARSLSVTLHDHRSFEATVVGAEPRKDIAVLQLVKPDGLLTPIRVLDKVQLDVGQKAVAIGNPFGLDQTLTTGIVSALGREVQGIGGVTSRDMIQTDAAINPGNSGGPLLDSAGYLIGMNTMIYSRSGASAGIGFAVPASAISRVVSQIIEFGKVKQVGLGVQIDPSQRLERRFGIKGVVILDVIAGTPAARLGLRGIQTSPRGLSLGDVIVGINDEEVDDYDNLYNSLDNFEPGAKVKVWVMRDKERVGLDFELIEIP